MNGLSEWPEPIVRVQTLSENQLPVIPDQYIKPLLQRPSFNLADHDHTGLQNIPIIDFSKWINGGPKDQQAIMDQISDACLEWGFFQLVNHGIPDQLLDAARDVWHDFFHQPMEVKQRYANAPATYEGYGSRLGVQKGAILDWADYYFLRYLPSKVKDHNKWPSQPALLRDVTEEYLKEIAKVCKVLLKIFSLNLGLQEDYLEEAMGGDDYVGGDLRVNFYPKCPQPDLTLGLSAHSDIGAMTILLPDEHVSGLQVQKAGEWITVKPAPHAIIVNLADQIQVLSNSIYKSVEHRVIVNQEKERVSLAFFFNPKGDVVIKPATELVTTSPVYQPMTFDEYRLFIRSKGPQGKSQLDSLKSPKQY